ncbi:26S protease regulatory subunit 8 [Giardia muris]|uniref:26S protease regulatory subunit 8 n=1 Tax=Giardia muris TaxID=5742 RepID=A0A4Z1T0G6_GIAMU|nr:26S protease regulatory subunit 8 [Giardia muris]|eukprot:TNJ26407.1 26S protease regulatory subunit 8 [Giardia muris]
MLDEGSRPESSGLLTLEAYFRCRLENVQALVAEHRRVLEAVTSQRDALNGQVKQLKEELATLQESACDIAEVIRPLPNNRCYVKTSTEDRQMVSVSGRIAATDLKPGLRVALKPATNEITMILPRHVNPAVSLMKLDRVPDQSYDEIGGLSRQLLELREILELPIKHPEVFKNLGIPMPKGVLLYGAPGCGKSAVARAVAHHCGCAFIRVSGSELVSKYIGEGSRMVRQVFQLALQSAPSIVFIDECDSIGGKRGTNTHGGESEVNRTMTELLSQLDGFEENASVKLIMATNRIDTLDEALLRPGRVDRKVEFPLPDLAGRVEIMRIHSRKMNLVRRIDLKKISQTMEGATGSDCRAVCVEAGMFALRERRNFVTEDDFSLAATKVMAWKEIDSRGAEKRMFK